MAAHFVNTDWNFPSRTTPSPIEALHPYPAKFVADLPRRLLDILPVPAGTAVFDPFCGSGTTLVECQRRGLPAVGIDLNPIACLISQVKTSPLAGGLAGTAASVVDQAAGRKQASKADVPDLPRLDHWFAPEVQRALAGLTTAVAIAPPRHRDALRLALSSIVVRVSNQESDTRYAGDAQFGGGVQVVQSKLRQDQDGDHSRHEVERLMKLTWHDYRYYPYERALAMREIAALFPASTPREVLGGLELPSSCSSRLANRLTYVSRIDGERGLSETQQSCLETTARKGKARQATRYSVHGLHEYKGKFNPQVARALLNVLGIMPGQRVLDPFCGSGTTLVECAHLGAAGYGADINPLAVYISNAKLQALATAASELGEVAQRLMASLRQTPRPRLSGDESPRRKYLESWFDADIIDTIERVRHAAGTLAEAFAPVFLTIASNLLRDYSRQDPQDLRVRRRKSSLPARPFIDSLRAACEQSIKRIGDAQLVLQPTARKRLARATLCDATALASASQLGPFDAAITSPPYAMALPYVDIHRLSLVWLGLVGPADLTAVESVLVGSRELRGRARSQLIAALADNEAGLPANEVRLCRRLASALGPDDGFRRQAVPILLYRYFANMRDALRSVRDVLLPGAPFALIVGRNHTVLGGERHDIDTPAHLANMAAEVGWQVEERMPLQTYQRYGYHMKNAVAHETLLLLRKPS